MSETVLPAIPRVPMGENKRALDAIKECLEVRLGRRGQPLDEGLTRRDLTEDAEVMAWISALVVAGAVTFLNAPESIVLVGGLATATGNSNYLILDTEGGAASDDLERIDGFDENDVVMIRAASSSRAITVKRGDYFKMKSDFTLNSIFDRIQFECIGGDVMVQIGRNDNA